MFHIGQRVVCVNSEPQSILDGLMRGKVYVVRDCFREGELYAIRVEEIVRPRKYSPDGWEFVDDLPYWADRFRPVNEANLDVFHVLLNPVKEDA